MVDNNSRSDLESLHWEDMDDVTFSLYCSTLFHSCISCHPPQCSPQTFSTTYTCLAEGLGMRLFSPSLSISSSYSSSSFPSILLSLFISIASFSSPFLFTFSPLLLFPSLFLPSFFLFPRSSEEREEDHMREGRRKEEKRRKEGKTSSSNTTSGSATTARQSKVNSVDLRAEPLLSLLLNYHTNDSHTSISNTSYPSVSSLLFFSPSLHFLPPPSFPFLFPFHLPSSSHLPSPLISPLLSFLLYLSISPPFSSPRSLFFPLLSFPLLLIHPLPCYFSQQLNQASSGGQGSRYHHREVPPRFQHQKQTKQQKYSKTNQGRCHQAGLLSCL